MKVLLSSIGSRGDVQPILAVARELVAQGHEATLCVPPNFKSWVESYSVACVPIGPDLEQFTVAMGAAMPTREQMVAMVAGSVRDQFRVIGAAAQGCNVIIAAGALQTATRSVCQALNIPYKFVAYAPGTYPSLDLPPAKTMPGPVVIASQDDIPGLWQAEGASWNQTFLGSLNEERGKLSLAPVEDMMRYLFTDKLWLATDGVLGPAPLHSEINAVQTGAWFLQDDTPLPESLKQFLDAGDAPIYFGFGSMPASDKAARPLVEAARALGRRAILLQGWGNLNAIDSNADCISINNVNHSELFKRVAVVVHHGGAGTTHAAARAGCPQVIVPHKYDQFYWGQRVNELGIGATGPQRDHLTTETLIAALRDALHPDKATHAKTLATRMDLRGASSTAKRIVEEFG